MTANEAEALVRMHWEWVQVRLSEPYEGLPQGKWVARLPLLPFSQIGFDTEAEAWLAAAAFTEQRREEIRQVEREIEVLLPRFGEEEDWGAWAEDWREWAQNRWSTPLHTAASVREHHTWARILAREQAALEALRQGWKEASDGE